LPAITNAEIAMQKKITKDSVDKAKLGEHVWFMWDTELKGFGLKVTPAGSKIYIAQYRMGGRGSPTRRYTVGKHGTLTPEQARKSAQSVLGNVANGKDPQSQKMTERAAITFSELCDVYIREGCETKKPSTIATDKGRIERHIKPLLGRKKTKDLTPNDIKRFLSDIANGKTAIDEKTKAHGRARVTGGKGTANRTTALVASILTFAVSEGIRTDNPARGIKYYATRSGERYLTHEELSRLGETLNKMEFAGKALAELEAQRPNMRTTKEIADFRKRIAEASKDTVNENAIAAVRLLILTGCRKSEILSLKWHEIDFNTGCLRLDDSKTGQKIVMVGAPALQILANLPKQVGSDYVLPAMRGKGHYIGLPKAWARIRKLTGFEGVRIHDLRHSFASVGASSGMGLQVVGKLLGHSNPKTTARYSHLADDPVRAAADRIAGSIAAAMGGNAETEVLEFKKKS
jgi:integrase